MHVIEMVLVTGYGGHPPGHCLVAQMGMYMIFFPFKSLYLTYIFFGDVYRFVNGFRNIKKINKKN